MIFYTEIEGMVFTIFMAGNYRIVILALKKRGEKYNLRKKDKSMFGSPFN